MGSSRSEQGVGGRTRRRRSRIEAAGVVTLMLILSAPASPAAAQLGELPNRWLSYDGVLNSAHRGGAFEAPENTLFAFREALLRGADQLETDVALTADGEVVVIHDTSVDRTTEGSGAVSSLTLAQVQALDAAWCFEPGGYRDCDVPREEDTYPYRGVRTGQVAPPPGYAPDWFAIPTLRQVLESFPGIPLNVEIKPTFDPLTDREAAEAVAALLSEFDRTDDVIVVSQDDSVILQFKQAAPEVDTAPGIVFGATFFATTTGPLFGVPDFAGLHRVLQFPVELFGIEIVTEDFVEDVHRSNLALHVFTINDGDEMTRLAEFGVDSIMTDRVALLEDRLDALGLAYTTAVELIPPCPAPDRTSLPDTNGCNLVAFPPGTFTLPTSGHRPAGPEDGPDPRRGDEAGRPPSSGTVRGPTAREPLPVTGSNGAAFGTLALVLAAWSARRPRHEPG